jgi:uncharacterized membrane-anchored protein YitT (DUF2179 family)
MTWKLPFSGPWRAVADDSQIILGSVLDGLGIGLVFRCRGTTGGTDVIARIAHRFLGIGIGQALLVINTAIFAAAAFRTGTE